MNAYTPTYAFESLRADWHCGFLRAVTLDEAGLWNVRAFAELAIARLLRSITVVMPDWENDAPLRLHGVSALVAAPLALDELVVVGRGPYDAAARLHDKAKTVRVALTQ